MARVPNTNTFSLNDVVVVLELKGIGDVVFTGSGDDDLQTRGTFTQYYKEYRVQIDSQDPDTFKWSDSGGVSWNATMVTITELWQTLNNGVEIRFNSSDGHIINDRWDFVCEKALTQCFDEAVAAKFDPFYQGDKDRLSNFRNYGWLIQFTAIETEDHGSSYKGVCGNEDFIFVAYYDGIISYNINSSGYMLHKGYSDDDTLQTDLIVDESGIVFSVDDYRFIRGWTYDVFGDLTLECQLDTYSAYGEAKAKGPYALCTDNNKFLFVINWCPSSSVHYQDVMIMEFGFVESLMYITYKSYYRSDYDEIYHDLFYADGYLFLITSSGIKSFSVNQTTGELTLVDNHTTYNSFNRLWVFGGYIYCTSSVYGMMLYSYDGSGNITYVDNSADIALNSIFGDVNSELIYALSPTNDKIYAYRRGSGTIEYCGITPSSYETYPQDLWCPPNMTNSGLVLTRMDVGITSFEIT